MRKDEAKRALRKLIERMEELQADAEELKYEIEDAAESIEAYEGRDELTQAQQERQEWFEEQASALDDIIDLELNFDVE